ncbi:MAG: glycosyltransferase family 2 protein, partial [Solirubrobacterales bacterium]
DQHPRAPQARRVISVVIPVRNAGGDLRRCLEGIGRQRTEQEVEIVVVDSASTDGSAALARTLGARVHEIPVERFDHGATRNLGAELARGEVLVFTSQDAYPVNDSWLAKLTAPLADSGVGGVYGRQVAHLDARPPEVYFLDFLYGPRPRVQAAPEPEQLSMETTLFSNVTSAIPRELLRRFPFADDLIMSEDQEWAARVLLEGYRLVYEPEAVVRHSHPYTIPAAFKRFFDSGASAERAFMPVPESARVLRRSALRYGRGELAWLWRSGHRRWVPYAVVYELAKYAGLQLGARHRRLPTALKRRLSAHPAFWEREPGRLPQATDGM